MSAVVTEGAVGVGELVAAAAAFRAVLAGFEARLVTGDDARTATEALVACERAVAAARLAASLRAGECGAFARGPGVRDAADWMGRLSGGSRRQAVDELRLAERLTGLPATRAALAEGRLSVRQVMEVAGAEAEAPGGEDELLALAARADLASLRDAARKRRLRAVPPDQLARRQRAARFHRHWTDELGMTRGAYALEPEEGTAFVARLDAETDRRVRADRLACNQALRDGRLVLRDGREQHAADALAALGQADPGAGRARRGRRAEVVLVGDIRTVLAGDDGVGRGCHVLGGGPVPVARVREVLDTGDAFIKGVVHDGVDILAVEHLGRRMPAELRTALALGGPPEFDGPVCIDEGCGRRHHLELDHRLPVAAGGPTSYRNLDHRCWVDHQHKTAADRSAGLLTPPDPAPATGERAPP